MRCAKSVPRGAALHGGDVGIAVGRAAGALAFPQHLAQAFHGGVVGVVQRIEPFGQQFDCLTDAARLVNAALLADRQVHGQVQKRVGLLRRFVVVAGNGCVHVRQVCVVLGMLGNPQAGQRLDGFHGRAALGFGVHTAQKAAHIGLRGVEHGLGG